MLKGIISLTLITLLFCNSACFTLHGFEFVGPLNPTAIACLTTSDPSIRFVAIRIYQISGNVSGGVRGVDQGGVQTFTNKQSILVNLITYPYIEICRGDPSDTVANALSAAYPGATPFSQMYLKIEPNSIPGCMWDGYTHKQNCDYITEVFSSLTSVFSSNYRSGVQFRSSFTSWQSFFGNSCNNFPGLNAQSLWYVSYDNQGQVNSDNTYSDFKPFGGWTAPTFKTASKSLRLTLCDNDMWKALGNRLQMIF